MKMQIHNIYITYKIVYKPGADSSSRSREIAIWKKKSLKKFNLKYLWNLWTNRSAQKTQPRAIQNLHLSCQSHFQKTLSNNNLKFDMKDEIGSSGPWDFNLISSSRWAWKSRIPYRQRPRIKLIIIIILQTKNCKEVGCGFPILTQRPIWAVPKKLFSTYTLFRTTYVCSKRLQLKNLPNIL